MNEKLLEMLLQEIKNLDSLIREMTWLHVDPVEIVSVEDCRQQLANVAKRLAPAAPAGRRTDLDSRGPPPLH